MLSVYACENTWDLGERVFLKLKAFTQNQITPFDAYSCKHFADGEFQPCFLQSVRGNDVFIIQSTNPNSDNLIELLLAIDAAKRASAKSVVAVIPYFGWARQDRKDKPRVPISSKLMASLIETAGADRVITFDLHADQIQGFFQIPVDHLSASAVLIPELKKVVTDNYVIASPDIGGMKRAHKFAQLLNCPLICCHKHRAEANKVDSMMIIGDVTDKDVIIVDDMCDTAGTICKAAQLIKDSGAHTVSVCFTHAILSDPAVDRLSTSCIDLVYTTDTIPGHTFINNAKFRVISVDSVLARVILNVYQNKTICSEYV